MTESDVMRPRRKYDAKIAAEVVEAVRGGMNKCAAARKFNVSRLQVHSYCKKAGVVGPLDEKWAEATRRNEERWVESTRIYREWKNDGGSASDD